LYFKKDDKSTSDTLRLDSATVLDDTTDSGKPLKQLAHLLKSQNANSWVRQNGCIKTNRLRQDSVHLVLECRKVTVGWWLDLLLWLLTRGQCPRNHQSILQKLTFLQRKHAGCRCRNTPTNVQLLLQCTSISSAVEALRNALYKFKTYLLTCHKKCTSQRLYTCN